MKFIFRSTCFLILSIALLWSCSTKSNQDFKTSLSEGPSKGHLIVAGGNLSDTSVFKKFMELAGGPDAPIVIVTTAMTDDDLSNPDFYPNLTNWWKSYGFNNFSFLHTRSKDSANHPDFYKPVADAKGLWFMGGRQWRLVDAYAGTKILDEFNALLERGGVIGGSSAGASIQGSYLARGDTKTNTLMMGDHEEGFGFISNVAIDQHLLAMNRQFDIFEILDAHPGMLGLGLDENTAIVVQANEFEVIGQSYVAVYDDTFYREVRDKDDWSHIVGEVSSLPEGSRKFYLLKHGQQYNFEERKVISD